MDRRALAAACALAAAVGQAAELGTLFTTPEERERLDRLRRGDPVATGVDAARGGAPALTGYVKRSDGRTTIWVDGSPVTVPTAKAAPWLDPGAVRAYSSDTEGVKVERKPPR